MEVVGLVREVPPLVRRPIVGWIVVCLGGLLFWLLLARKLFSMVVPDMLTMIDGILQAVTVTLRASKKHRSQSSKEQVVHKEAHQNHNSLDSSDAGYGDNRV